MKKYRLYRYILSQSVSLMMIGVVLVAFIVYMVTGRNLSAFLIMAFLNMVYHVIENAKMFKKLADNNIDIRKLML